MQKISMMIRCAALAVLSVLSLAYGPADASAYYLSLGGVLGVSKFPLPPGTPGSFFMPSTAAHDLTVAGSDLYWIDGGNVYRIGVDGSGAQTLNGFNPSPLSLAVDATGGHYFVSLAGSIAEYPLTSSPGGGFFAPAVAAHDLTVAGSYLYWLASSSVYRVGLDGIGLEALKGFGTPPLSLAVDAAGGRYYVSLGGGQGISEFSLLSPSLGGFFAPAGAAHDLTVAGNYLYWLDGNSVYRAGLDGSDLTLINTVGGIFPPLSLAVYDSPVIPPVVDTPEPASTTLVFAGLFGLWLVRRKRA